MLTPSPSSIAHAMVTSEYLHSVTVFLRWFLTVSRIFI
jgi:hypothetical protein